MRRVTFNMRDIYLMLLGCVGLGIEIGLFIALFMTI